MTMQTKPAPGVVPAAARPSVRQEGGTEAQVPVSRQANAALDAKMDSMMFRSLSNPTLLFGLE